MKSKGFGFVIIMVMIGVFLLENNTEGLFQGYYNWYDMSNSYDVSNTQDDGFSYYEYQKEWLEYWENGLADSTENSGEDDTKEPGELIEPDGRIPNFMPSGYNPKTVKYKWTGYNGYNYTWELPIWEELYNYYSSLERYYTAAEYYHYINDEQNSVLCKDIAESIVKGALDKGLSKRAAVLEVVAFVQGLSYISDLDETGQSTEYPKYPVETLMEGGGDCEDTTILLATMLKELGYGVVLIHFEGHIMVGIAGSEGDQGAYYLLDGVRYYMIETTAFGWGLGMLPEDLQTKPARLYKIN